MIKKHIFSKSIDFIVKSPRIISLKKLNVDPIFIGGCGRSGTTLLLSVLGAHPRIQAIDHEAYFFNKFREGVINDWVRRRRIEYNIIQNPIKKTAHRWCEKTPSNILYINQIERFFDENYKFIHLVRDGRDVVTSRHPLLENEYWVSVDRWVNDVQAGLNYRDNKNVLLIKYEDLIINFNQTCKAIMDFIDEDYVTEVRDYHLHTNVKKDRAWKGQVRKISADSIKKWEKEEHKERINEFYQNHKAIELLKELGY
ncbi:sulfotransferase family protein [Zhouia amylolytica]|uniref:Sulfotransferase domain-containing protein n=1 Tax=Zhouia amylolytica AD3 TaxID=1286632 RepID=W2UNS5_9FLAO|nr:sulfotransferase [Zhouia amylolytica]ETN95795.1 hypothetical protein P278_15170 [Zhouia amylolytica AD3]